MCLVMLQVVSSTALSGRGVCTGLHVCNIKRTAETDSD